MKQGWYGNLKAGVIILMLSIIPVGFAWNYIYLGYLSKSWPSIVGEGVKIDRYTSNTREGGKQYQVAANYRYSVDGRFFFSDRVTVDGDYKSPFKTKRDKEYSVLRSSGELVVYYNPQNHEYSILIPGFTPNGLVPLMFSVFLAVCGSLIIYAWYRMSKQ